MSGISHFQHYSQRENHVTNNTLLLLRHFYRRVPGHVEAFLNSIFDDDFQLGLQFNQQVKGSNSVPDALIRQLPFEIYFETKMGSSLDYEQMTRHLDSIRERLPIGEVVLVGLVTEKVNTKKAEQFKAVAKERGVSFSLLTFQDMISELRGLCQVYEKELGELLSDYENYLDSENLLPSRSMITVVPCGTSLTENLEHEIYFEPASRYSKGHYRFIGLYKEKQVRFLAEIDAIIVGKLVDNDFVVTKVEKGAKSPSHIERIVSTIDACKYFGDFGLEENRYYLFSDIKETSFVKTSKGGIWGPRVFDLQDYDEHPKDQYSLEEGCSTLRGKTFQ